MMKEFVRFATQPTTVKIEGIAGMVNGYKINEFTHGGRNVNIRNQNYYYIPHLRTVVTYKATTARVMKISEKRKFNFRETLHGGYAKTIHVDASVLFDAAAGTFN
jgi:hypothetical protein